MKIKNILVIGNGFDLAIKRKTSYEDFIKFACQITGFPNESISHSLCDDYAIYGKESFIDQYKLFQKNLVSEFIDFLVKKYNEQNNFRNLTEEKLKHLDKYYEYFQCEVSFQGREKTFNNLYNSFYGHGIQYPPDESFEESFIKDLEKRLQEGVKKSNPLHLNALLDIVETNSEFKKMASESNDEISLYYRDFFLKFKNPILDFILLKKDYLDNWSSLEQHISHLINGFVELKEKIEELEKEYTKLFIDNLLTNNELETLIKEIGKHFSFLPNSTHINFLIRDIGYTFHSNLKPNSSYQSSQSTPNNLTAAFEEYHKKLVEALNSFAFLLELYLTYLDKIEDKSKFEVPKILSSFEQIDNILTFNYTDTAQQLYNVSNDNIHYIHGKLNFAKDTIETTNLVLGIEDTDHDIIDNDLIDFQKTFQRIVKKTGSKYRSFFNFNISDELVRVIIYGHSLDVLDQEIFKEIFKVLDNVSNNSKNQVHMEIIILYFGKTELQATMDLKSKVRNLSTILGKDKLIELTANNLVHFIDSSKTEEFKQIAQESKNRAKHTNIFTYTFFKNTKIIFSKLFNL
ncbi:AbiH family protein [Streptococcus equinus]|uniref:AbiH family protein n=1 Tax=Streptococcus equinus TaxID=1335 RepID=UPI0006908C2D|nr:AbiH family protein [Streptococcus equinus]